MSVKSLLETKIAVRKFERNKAQEEAHKTAQRHRRELAAAVEKIESDLEGLDFTRVGDGDFRVKYRDFDRDITIWVRVEWSYDEVCYSDECRDKEWCLKVGISSRALNVPDLYCGVDSFAETFSDYLLRLS